MYVRTRQSLKRFLCLPNQVWTIIVSLSANRPFRERDVHFSRYSKFETNVTFVPSRQWIVHAPLADARTSEITFQQRYGWISMERGVERHSYARINKKLDVRARKKEECFLTNLYQASSGFPINSRHGVRRFYCRFAWSASIRAEFPWKIKRCSENAAGMRHRDVLTVRLRFRPWHKSRSLAGSRAILR